ncbi:MAG: hypothetical protein ACK2UB_05420, partial [Anaerolineales bacterium]
MKISLMRFLVMGECPAEWLPLDLYLFRDGDTVFYVGRSYRAFDRVWNHIRNGYKARSDVGRFLLANWPRSLHFDIELLNSQSPAFDRVGRDAAAAEELLIRRHRPCFNDSLNDDPIALPAAYRPPSSPIRCPRSLRGLRSQAARAVREEEK